MSDLRKLSIYAIGFALTTIVGASVGFSLTVLFALGLWAGLIAGWFLEE